MGARQVEGARWSGRERDLPASHCSVPIAEPADGRAAEDGLRAALIELARQLAASTDADALSAIKSVHAAVSARWATQATLVWSDALADAAQRDAHLRAELSATGADVQADDRIVFDDQCRYGQPCAVVHYPAALLSALSEAALLLDADLRCTQPMAQGAIAAAARQLGARAHVALVEPGLMQFVAVERGRLRFGPTSDEPELDHGTLDPVLRLWQRQQLRGGGLAGATRLHVADLRVSRQAPAQTSDAALALLDLEHGRGGKAGASLACAMRLRTGSPLDAAMPANKHTRRYWIAAGLTLIAALASVVEAGRLHLTPHEPPRADVQMAVGASLAAPTRAQLDRVRSANAAIRELNLPVTELLQTLLPPRGSRVALLAVDVEPNRAGTEPAAAAGVRVTAVAPDATAMARYVDGLNQRQRQASAQVLQHQLDEGDAAQRLRFVVQWWWRE